MARRRVRTIGKIVKEMKWVMGTNESVRQRKSVVMGKELVGR